MFSVKGENAMKIHQTVPQPMSEDELKHIKQQIIKTYLFLISHTEYDPKVVEVMKLSALADAQRRYETKEPW